MNIVDLINPILAVGSMGLLFGAGLGVASKLFAVPVDERVEAVKMSLPGANCGGCGFAGCDAFAKAVVEGSAKCSACPVSNEEERIEIARIMGVKAEVGVRKVAQVKCIGTCDVAREKYVYEGIDDCVSAHLVHGGGKSCRYGCLGLGTCGKACPFDAIDIENGVAVVKEHRCKACSVCVAVCPRQLIVVEEVRKVYTVKCRSKDKGKDVKAVCQKGCIGCGICGKQCEEGAITIQDHLAAIDVTLCTGCGKCSVKCPVKVIVESSR